MPSLYPIIGVHKMKLISIKPELIAKFSKLDSEVLIKEKRPNYTSLLLIKIKKQLLMVVKSTSEDTKGEYVPSIQRILICYYMLCTISQIHKDRMSISQ